MACRPEAPLSAVRRSRSPTTIARACPFPYSTPGMNPSRRRRRALRDERVVAFLHLERDPVPGHGGEW